MTWHCEYRLQGASNPRNLVVQGTATYPTLGQTLCLLMLRVMQSLEREHFNPETPREVDYVLTARFGVWESLTDSEKESAREEWRRLMTLLSNGTAPSSGSSSPSTDTPTEPKGHSRRSRSRDAAEGTT
jgi:hypothetical protein